ncbi:MAG: hypothetical protein ACPGXY_05290 [Alphaproteobacteria bacterium]
MKKIFALMTFIICMPSLASEDFQYIVYGKNVPQRRQNYYNEYLNKNRTLHGSQIKSCFYREVMNKWGTWYYYVFQIPQSERNEEVVWTGSSKKNE